LHLDSKVLGIATVLTIALGFASQTAVSNTISGLFLVFEKPFQVGDHIEMGDLIGELLSIDLLSIKIRTFQNSLVRVPNELLLKSQFINLTRFPIRRLDIPFRISVKEDVQRVRKIINDTAAKNLNALETPAPILFFEKFDDYAIELRFSVWVRRELFMEFKNGFSFEIQQALKDNDVLMPVAQMNLLRHNH
jgi:small-conductance mechanosensitive channel